jgi:alpha-tubulin suppressor-like RCC1 family protein
VLLTNGSVQCWGKNDSGQLGDGTQTFRATPVTVAGLSDVVALTSSLAGNCAIVRDGTLRCWGDNSSGQLGDGTTMNRPAPVSVQRVEDAVAIASFGHSCAVIKNGTLKCWGSNSDGQLGTGAASTTPSPAAVGAVGITSAVNVSVFGTQTCVVLRGGAGQCWGAGFLGGAQSTSLAPVALSVPQSIKSIVVGAFHACSLHSHNDVYCWGPSTLGGNAVSGGPESPASVVGLSATSLALGAYSTWVIKSDGNVAWWNANTRPATLGAAQALVVSAMLGQVCEILQDGTVSCGSAENTAGAAHIMQPGIDLW